MFILLYSCTTYPRYTTTTNPNERTTLLIDFYKESLYTKEKFEAYYQNYSSEFEGLENLFEVYEKRKQEK